MRLMRMIMLPAFLVAAVVGCGESGTSLEFRLAQIADGDGLTEYVYEPTGETFYLHDNVFIDESDVDSATVDYYDERPMVMLFLTRDGGNRFAAYTGANVGKRVAIVIKGRLVSVPKIQAPITGGRAMIDGSFSEQEAGKIAADLSEK